MKKLFITIFTAVLFLSPLTFCGAVVNSDVAIYFTPTSGVAGETAVTISSNSDISGATSVLFNETSVSPKTNDSKYYIDVTVPDGATTGKITVMGTTNNGNIVSASDFTVTSDADAIDTTGATDDTDDEDNEESSTITWSGLIPKCNTGDIDEDTGDYENSCGLNYLMQMVNKIINYVLIILATPLFVLIIVYVGFLFLTSGGDSGKVTKAKTIIKNAIIGYIIALAAWLIVKTILTTVGYVDVSEWFNI